MKYEEEPVRFYKELKELFKITLKLSTPCSKTESHQEKAKCPGFKFHKITKIVGHQLH